MGVDAESALGAAGHEKQFGSLGRPGPYPQICSSWACLDTTRISFLGASRGQLMGTKSHAV